MTDQKSERFCSYCGHTAGLLTDKEWEWRHGHCDGATCRDACPLCLDIDFEGCLG